MLKDNVFEMLNQDKGRIMSSWNRRLGDKSPTQKEAEFLSFPFKIRQNPGQFMGKYKFFIDKMLRFLQDEKVATVNSIQIIRMPDDPEYIKYKLEVTL